MPYYINLGIRKVCRGRVGVGIKVKSVPLWGKLLGAISLLALVFAGLAFVPTGQVAYAPNAPIDLDGRISVEGKTSAALQGRMYLVGVSERPVKLLQRILLDIADPDVDFGPITTGKSNSVVGSEDVRAMDEAKQVAAGIAFDMSGEPAAWSGTGVVVEKVRANGPSANALVPGDIIVKINTSGVETSVGASRIINSLPPGSNVKLSLQRAGTPMLVNVKSVKPDVPDSTRKSEIGVELSTIGLRVRLPRNVKIDSGSVVGPSAGLAFSLYLYDTLDDVDLLRGRSVVVTGSLAPDGAVLEVGRIRQKALAAQQAGSEVLIVPSANASEAREAVTSRCGEKADCVKVVPVRTVQDAVDLLLLSDNELSRVIASR